MIISSDLRVKLQKIRHVVLDMDGTIYKGSTLFPQTLPFLERLRNLGIGYTFLTNNPSKNRGDYLAHLRRFGIAATEGQMFSAVQATFHHLRTYLPEARRLFLFGTRSMAAEFVQEGYADVGNEDQPDAVVVAFDTEMDYRKICQAAWWIQQGKPYIATNPDKVCPTDQPTVLPDCGAVCALFKEATGRDPDAVLGKPDPSMLEGIMQAHDLRPYEVAMVGDRLYTDIEMARRAEVFSVLVLTGETDAKAAHLAIPAPDLTLNHVGELSDLLGSRAHTKKS